MPSPIVITTFIEDYQPRMVPVRNEDGTEVRNLDGSVRFERKMVAVDLVEYMPSAQESGLSLIRRPVLEMLDLEDDGDPLNVVAQMARERAEVIGPAYANWKKGVAQPEIPGHPLAAWPGLSKAEADILRHHGFQVVEQLATSPDHKFENVALPDPLGIKQRAIRFLAAGDQERSANLMAEKDAKIERLEGNVDELKGMVEQMLAATRAPVAPAIAEAEAVPAPRKRAAPPRPAA